MINTQFEVSVRITTTIRFPCRCNWFSPVRQTNKLRLNRFQRMSKSQEGMHNNFK